MWKFFLIGQNRLSNARVKVLIFKKFQRAQILISFVVKIGRKLPFTFMSKRRQQIRNLSFKNYYSGPKKKRVFGIKKKCSSCFDSDSALKTIDAQMFFWSVYLKTHKKKLLTVKNAIFAIFGR